MRMLNGNFNVYWHHDALTPGNVRAACYGTDHNSGGLVPEVGDVINDFHGLYGAPIRVRVVSVEQIGQGCTAFEVWVTSDPAEQPTSGTPGHPGSTAARGSARIAEQIEDLGLPY